MGSGGAGCPVGVAGRERSLWAWLGPAGRGQAPVAPHSGLFGLAPWGWGGRDGGVFLSSETSFWEKLPYAKWCRFGFARMETGWWGIQTLLSRMREREFSSENS